MIAPLSKYLDSWTIQFVTRILPPALGSNLRLEAAIQFLTCPDFIPAGSSPAQNELEDPLRFHPPSPRRSNFAKKNTVMRESLRSYSLRPVCASTSSSRNCACSLTSRNLGKPGKQCLKS
jgi:hypothetical protein